MTRKILIDTNTYLRLAEVLDPLLLSHIPGEDGGELWILPDLYKELNRSPRLRHDFSWTASPEMVENRKRCRWRLDSDTKNQIESAYKFALRLSQETQNGASPFDIRCLAYGYVLGILVITDDTDMRALADELEVATTNTLGLLKRMLDAGVCDMNKVRSVVKYWIAVDDLPANYRSDFHRLFGEAPPIAPY